MAQRKTSVVWVVALALVWVKLLVAATRDKNPVRVVFIKVGFEGGQMPMHRRLPKRGFVSLTKADTAHVRLYELAAIAADEIDLLVLKQAGIVKASARSAKVFLSGELGKAVKLRGVAVTKGARAAIEAAGGTIAD